jgi:sugar (pentulose or hexulose) kinase
MGEPLVLTYDMGTQSARALLVNAKGGILASHQKIYEEPYFSKEPLWAEQKPDFYWNSLCESSRALKQNAAALWPDIIAITCTTIRDTCLCLDKNNVPLRDVIVWSDDREAKLPPLRGKTWFLLRLANALEGVELQRRVSACNWIMVNQPEIWEKTHKFVLISTWLTYKLCGNLIDSNASAIGHIPFDSRIRGWMKKSDIRRLIFEISDDKLFPVVEPCSVLGEITARASEETGLTAGLPLIATGSDKGCETLGLSVLSSNKAALSFGTTATVQLSSRKYFEPLPFMPAYAAVVPGYFNPEVQIYRGYWLLSWFKREFAAKETAAAEKLRVSAEQLLDEKLKDIKPGCDGLIMEPYFSPGVTMPFARGAVLGFSQTHTRIHLYRSIIEGINFALMEGLRGMEKRGKLIVKEIYAGGGGSKSDAVCRITASMFGLPVYRIQTYEASGIGSSLAAFKSKGVFSSWEEGVKAMCHVKDEFLPDRNEHEVYEEIYSHIFEKIFSKVAPLYEEIQRILT